MRGATELALAGAGGKVYVGLEYAKALQGINVMVLPSSGADGFNPLNLDQTIDKFSPDVRGAGQ